MATFLSSESRRLYSWWWDSHISPKNSKWLQENLTDIDAKVKAMIKIINEDADSFARRAEMYYKKRPELMKLVEDFYRAYRALAERYDHATGELRLAQKTMAEAFPSHAPSVLSDDASSCSESSSPMNPHLVRAFFDPDYPCKELDVDSSRKGLKQLNEMFQTGEAMLRELKLAEEKLMDNLPNGEDKDSKLDQNSYLLLDKKMSCKTAIHNEPGRVAKAEAEMQSLKEALAKVEAERDAVLVDYRQNVEKLSNLENELNSVQNDAKELGNHASEAQSEVKALKESLVRLEAERDSSLDLYKQSSERLAILEAKIAAVQEDSARWSGRAIKAETESQNLKQEISAYESEKQDALVRYEESINKISSLEEKLLLAEENVKQLLGQIDLAESEIRSLEDNLSSLSKAKEDAYLRYHQCLDTISRLQNELMDAREDIKRLNSEILLGSAKLRSAEDQCAQLDMMNQSLKLEADGLAQKITEKDRQLLQKQNELEKLMNHLQGEQSRFVQVEATLDTLQNLHSQSQEEQRALVFELTNGLQMLTDLELRKQDLELEIQHLKEENRELNDLKLASSITEREMEHEVLSLREIKENFEVDVRRQAEQNDVLQLQVQQLKAEIKELLTKYQDLLQQVQSTGIDPQCVSSSIKDLLDENSRLKGISAEEKAQKEALLRKLDGMDELFKRSVILESSLSDVNVELECSKEKMKVLQESCDVLSAEKSSLIAEKSALLTQLQMTAENMRHLLEKNSSLEKSLQGANAELQDLSVKSRSLEDVCQFLKDEKSSLHSERSRLISQLENVEKKVGGLETKFTTFEDRHAASEKEKESAQNQITELRVALSAEKQDSKCLAQAYESRLTDLKDNISYLQEENKCRKKDFEEQLEKAVNAQVEIFILKKFLQDMDERNSSLTAECQRRADAEKYSEIVISELESENMMQHLETELLLDRIDKIRRGICQVLKALEIDDSSETEPEIFLPHIAVNIKEMKRDLSEGSDDNQQLVIQNAILSAAVGQLSSEGSELEKEKEVLKNEFFFLNQQHAMLEHEKGELLERSERLDILAAEEKMKQKKLEAEMEVLNLKQESLQNEYAVLQEEHSNVLRTKRCLQDRLSKAEEEKHILFEENTEVIYEAVSFSNDCVVLRNSCVQKSLELEKNAEEMDRLLEACTDSKNEARLMKENLAIKEAENFQLSESVQMLEVKNMELDVFNDQLNCQFLIASEQINQEKGKLVEAEQKIETLQDVNTKLHTSIGTLEVCCDGLGVICGNLEMQILELSKLKECQEKEIASLREANKSLEAEVDMLNEDIEACNIREMILNSELQERSCEFGLWEAEAESFYFDLQTCGVREALYENTVHELGGLCNDLEDVSVRRHFKIEQMEDKMRFLEKENEGFKSQLAAYVPAIASLRKNILSLEQNPALQTKLHLIGTSEHQVPAICDLQGRDSADPDDGSSELDGLQELQDLRSRIEMIENVLATEKSSMQEYPNANVKLEAALKEIEELKSRVRMQPSKTDDLKDIPLDHASDFSSPSNRTGSDRLDQMLELWETAEQDSTRHSILAEEPAQVTDPGEIEKELGVDKQELCKSVTESIIITEKLQSDAQMLGSLHSSVQELKRKLGSYKKGNSAKAVEYERLRAQLQDVEVSVVRLVDENTDLTNRMEGSSSWGAVVDSTAVAGVSEQAIKEAERIEKLQLDVQKIQHILLNLEDENINNTKGKSRFLKSQTGIFMRDIIYGRGRKSEARRKLRFCGCFKPSQNGV